MDRWDRIIPAHSYKTDVPHHPLSTSFLVRLQAFFFLKMLIRLCPALALVHVVDPWPATALRTPSLRASHAPPPIASSDQATPSFGEIVAQGGRGEVVV